MNYSNPRFEAIIPNWPIHGAKRTTATFRIETVPGKGQRATRFTIDPRTGKPSAIKKLTYASVARIVDGDDGKTYIASWTAGFGHVSIMQGNMQFQAETIHGGDPRFADLLNMFKRPL